jgi:hypothetical protein
MMGELVLNEVEGEEFFYNLNGLFSAFIPNIPTFQHSSIPFRWHKQVAIKKLLISYSCRNSETFN